MLLLRVSPWQKGEKGGGNTPSGVSVCTFVLVTGVSICTFVLGKQVNCGSICTFVLVKQATRLARERTQKRRHPGVSICTVVLVKQYL